MITTLSFVWPFISHIYLRWPWFPWLIGLMNMERLERFSLNNCSNSIYLGLQVSQFILFKSHTKILFNQLLFNSKFLIKFAFSFLFIICNLCDMQKKWMVIPHENWTYVMLFIGTEPPLSEVVFQGLKISLRPFTQLILDKMILPLVCRTLQRNKLEVISWYLEPILPSSADN